MSDFLEQELKETAGKSYIIDISINEFKTIEELENFIKKAKESGIGTVMHYETSNFHCGVVLQIFDKNACEVKEHIGCNL